MKRMLRILCVCLALSMLCGCDMQPPSEESTPTMPTLSVTLTTTSATTTTVTTSVTAPTQTTQEAYVSQRPIETTTVTYKMTTPTAVFITYNETDTGRITTQDGLVLEYEVHRIGYNSGYESVTRKAQVVGYVGESTTVRIPATIDQYSITGVTFNEPLSIKEIYLDGMHADISSWKMPYLEDIWLLSNHSLWLFCAERYDEASPVPLFPVPPCIFPLNGRTIFGCICVKTETPLTGKSRRRISRKNCCAMIHIRCSIWPSSTSKNTWKTAVPNLSTS